MCDLSYYFVFLAVNLREKITNVISNVYIKAFGITLLALVLSVIVAAPFSTSTNSIFATPESGGDFNMSDLFAQFADRRPVRDLDDDIVIVDIGLLDRFEIAELLTEISAMNPAAIGVDVNFEEPRDEEVDDFLKESIANIKGLVLPLGVKESGKGFEIEDKPFFYNELPKQIYGVVNLPSKGKRSPIREFPVFFKMKNGDELNSYPVALAGIAKPETVELLRERGNRNEVIDYISREFKVFSSQDVFESERKKDIEGKIVLVGAMNEANDMHSTPVNSYMSGIMIHAYALSTILNRAWYQNIPWWVDYCLAFVICYVIVLTAISLTNKIRGILIRLAQVFFVYVAVWIGYILYVDSHVVVSFSHTLLMIAFGLFAVDIWNGFEAIGLFFKSKYIKFRNRKNNIQ